MILNKHTCRALGVAVLILAIAGPAHAAGSGMPWEGPLDADPATLLKDLMAKIIGTLAIIHYRP